MNELNRRQIHQAIAYFKWKTGQQLLLKVLFALIYLADRYHLRKYGQLLIGGHNAHLPEGYAIVDRSLPPINLEVAHCLSLHPEDKDTFLVELDLHDIHS